MSYSTIVTALLCWTALSVALVGAWCAACEVAIRRHRRQAPVRREQAAAARSLVLVGTRVPQRRLADDLFTDEELRRWMDGAAS